jgi:hypothetical protein
VEVVVVVEEIRRREREEEVEEVGQIHQKAEEVVVVVEEEIRKTMVGAGEEGVEVLAEKNTFKFELMGWTLENKNTFVLQDVSFHFKNS